MRQPQPAPEQQALFSSVPPNPFIKQVFDQFDSKAAATVLDVGCETGRNSIFLAEQGHNVVGMTIEPADIKHAVAARRQLGLAACSFIVGDARRLPFRDNAFDIVISNEVVHLLEKLETSVVLAAMRKVTKPGGLNIVSGYLIEPEATKNEKNRSQCLRKNELKDFYRQAGWTVIDYTESYKPLQYINEEEIVSSKAEIVAQRPWFKPN